MISGFGQLLTTPGVELDEQSRQEINAGVIENTNHITGLISKILELSDLVSTPNLPINDRVPVWQLASEAADSCGIRTNESISFDIQLDDYREGTGVGLSLARSLSRSLGGDVVLDTSYTFGARFILSLPLTSTRQ